MSEGNEEFAIVDLRDRPGLLEFVIEQNFGQWHDVTDIDRPGMAKLFTIDNPRDSLPVTLVAVIDGRYAGCVSLRERTMGMVTHPEAYLEESPWLSNMWVADWARGKQLATKLTLALEDKARALGIEQLYSSTIRPDSLYHTAGYADIAQRPFKGYTIYLIRKDL